jgi:hypothetical protein
MTYSAGPHQTYSIFQSVATGVWAEEPTRRALLDALHERRTFVTNGQKPVIALSVGGAPMGSETVSEKPQICLRIATPTPMVSWQIIRDGEVITGEENMLNRRPHAFSEVFEREISLSDAPGPGHHHYYANVHYLGPDGAHYHGRAVTTPVWVTVRREGNSDV